MAFSAADAKDVSLIVKDLKSRPYIDLTLDVMQRFGMNVPVNKNYEEFKYNLATLTPDTSFPQKREPSTDYSCRG